MQLRHPKRLLPAVLLLAFGLRMVGLNGRYLWYDEAFAILYAEKPFVTMLYGTIAQSPTGAAADVHPLLYYSLLHGWMNLAGQSLLAVRFLSVVFSLLTVAVVYRVAATLFSRRAGLTAALLTTFSPFALYYAQETRMYALLGLAAMGTLLAFLWGWQRGGRRYWVLFAISGALTLYAHNLGAFFVIMLDLWIGWQWWRSHEWHEWRAVVGAHGLMVLLFIPWLLVLPSQLGKLREAYWVTRPGVVELMQSLLVFHFTADNQGLPPWLLTVAIFVAFLTVAWLALIMVRNWCFFMRREGLAAYGLMVALAVGPVLLIFGVSQVQPVFIVRALLPSALAYYVLLGGVGTAVVTPSGLRWGVGLAVLGVMALALSVHYGYREFPRVPAAEVVAYLQPRMGATSVVVHDNKGTFFPMTYYDRTMNQRFLADAPGSADDTLALPTQEALGLYATEDVATAVLGARTVWFVVFGWEISAYAQNQLPHPVIAALSQHYRQVDVVTFDDLRLYQFEQ